MKGRCASDGCGCSQRMKRSAARPRCVATLAGSCPQPRCLRARAALPAGWPVRPSLPQRSPQPAGSQADPVPAAAHREQPAGRGECGSPSRRPGPAAPRTFGNLRGRPSPAGPQREAAAVVQHPSLHPRPAVEPWRGPALLPRLSRRLGPKHRPGPRHRLHSSSRPSR